MSNVSEFQANGTALNKLPVIIKVCVVIPLVCMFLCCISVMLHVFASHRQFLDTSRYILFAYMLINDALQVVTSVLLFALVVCQIEFPIVYCIPLLFISTATFQNTPLILAAMSLERYVAIVYPLQRPSAWRSDRIWVIILALWLISCLFPLIDFSIGKLNPNLNPFSTSVLCKTVVVNSSPIQMLLKAAVSVLFFAVVAVIILFTYVRILLETRKPITETLVVVHGWEPQDLAFFNYFTFILIPRFLSPLIYGFRDQSLRACVGRTILYCSQKISPGTL